MFCEDVREVQIGWSENWVNQINRGIIFNAENEIVVWFHFSVQKQCISIRICTALGFVYIVRIPCKWLMALPITIQYDTQLLCMYSQLCILSNLCSYIWVSQINQCTNSVMCVCAWAHAYISSLDYNFSCQALVCPILFHCLELEAEWTYRMR